MGETEEPTLQAPQPTLPGRWWVWPTAMAAVVAVGIWVWPAWEHYRFEKKRRETPPHVVEDLKLKLLWIPAGTFMMGTEGPLEWLQDLKKKYNDVKPATWRQWELAQTNNEMPATEVIFPFGFFAGETEVTQAQWEAVMGNNPSFFKGPSRPVENVTWGESAAFCSRLTERERLAGRIGLGQVYRLPTEAEWEFFCRAGSSGDFCFGNESSSVWNHAWLASNSGGETHEVAGKKPNNWGLHDTHGNVWEWCGVWNSQYPGGSVEHQPVKVSTGSFSNSVRGGNCAYDEKQARCARREFLSEDYKASILGFRIVLSSTP